LTPDERRALTGWQKKYRTHPARLHYLQIVRDSDEHPEHGASAGTGAGRPNQHHRTEAAAVLRRRIGAVRAQDAQNVPG
jgi:hypothetical protein